MWGSAADDARAYVSNNNFFNAPLDLAALKAVPNIPGAVAPPLSATGGLVSALDLWQGDILWTFTNPMPSATNATLNARSQAPVTVAGGVVFYSSMDATGKVFTLEAKTGRLLGSYATGAACASGASVVGSTAFVGSGYTNFGLVRSCFFVFVVVLTPLILHAPPALTAATQHTTHTHTHHHHHDTPTGQQRQERDGDQADAGRLNDTTNSFRSPFTPSSPSLCSFSLLTAQSTSRSLKLSIYTCARGASLCACTEKKNVRAIFFTEKEQKKARSLRCAPIDLPPPIHHTVV